MKMEWFPRMKVEWFHAMTCIPNDVIIEILLRLRTRKDSFTVEMGIYFFNAVVYKRFRGWWAKYAYVLSTALEAGIGVLALLLYFALQRKDIYGPNWWGLEYNDHCPLAHCPTEPGIQVDGCPVF